METTENNKLIAEFMELGQGIVPTYTQTGLTY